MNLKSFNLNMPVYFKLTNYGETILKAHWRGQYSKPSADGYYMMQGWIFIETFGKYIRMGNLPVVELAELYFEEEHLTDVVND